MYISRVEISHFRNLVSTSLSPSPTLNLICGGNGSGKSSLLEAVHYSLTGISYRTNRLSTVTNNQADCLSLFCELKGNVSHKVGLSRCRDLNHKTRLDGQDVTRRSELVQLVPIQLISPESLSLITEGSDLRRSYLDWGLFHVEQSFHFHLSHYQRSLRQRNAQLKQSLSNTLSQWDALLVDHGIVIDSLRRGVIEKLEPLAHRLLKQILPDVPISLSYRSGWPKDLDFSEALRQAVESDRKNHHTTVGPHRADLLVRTNGIKVSDCLSRGQIKLITVALKLAQILLVQESTDKKPIILIDDMAAELDPEHRELLMNTLQSLNTQVFVTTPDINLIPHNEWAGRKVFHVEHGKIKEVV